MKRCSESADFLYSDSGQLVGFYKQQDGLKLFTVKEATVTDLPEIFDQKV